MKNSKQVGWISGLAVAVLLSACGSDDSFDVSVAQEATTETAATGVPTGPLEVEAAPDIKPYVPQWSRFPSFGEDPEGVEKHADECLATVWREPFENIWVLFQERNHTAVVDSDGAQALRDSLLANRESDDTIFDIEAPFYGTAFLETFHKPVVVDLGTLERSGGVEVFAPKDNESRARDELDFTKVTFDQGYVDLLVEPLDSLTGDDKIYLQLFDREEFGVQMAVPPVVVINGVASVRGLCTDMLEENFDAAAQRLNLTPGQLADRLSTGEVPIDTAVQAQLPPQADPIPWEEQKVDERLIESAPDEIVRNLGQYTIGFEIGNGLKGAADEDTLALCVLTSIGWSSCSSIASYEGAPDIVLGPVPVEDKTIQLWLASSTEFYEKKILIGEIPTPEQPQQNTERVPTYRIDTETPVRTSDQLVEAGTEKASATFVGNIVDG